MSQVFKSSALALCALLLIWVSPAESEFAQFKIKLNTSLISPNHDGIKDYLVIELSDLSDGLRNPLNWECQISNEADEQVYFWRADKRKKRVDASISNLFFPSDKQLQPLRLFEQLYWDGRNSDEKSVTDGSYNIRIRIVDSKTNRIYTSSRKVVVDTSAPSIELRPIQAQIQIQNGSIQGQEFHLAQIARGATFFVTQLYRYGGPRISQKTWSGHLPSTATITWEDLNTQENLVGRYRYRVIAYDGAGNYDVADYSDLIVTSQPQIHLLRAKHPGFSPDGDGLQDNFELELVQMSSSGVPARAGPFSDFRLQILSESLDTVYYQTTGSGRLPIKINWDGRDQSGSIMSDGSYMARVIAGGQIVSDPLPIRIYRTPPDVRLSLSSNAFNPDGDGNQDHLSFTFFSPPHEIENWQMALYNAPLIDKKPSKDDPKSTRTLRKIYRIYQGRILPDPIPWDGKSDAGQLAESFEKYYLALEVFDVYGNRSTVFSDTITTGLVLRPQRPGETTLVARIPNQVYFDKDEQINARGKAVLDRIQSALKYYGSYSEISIEAHSAAAGREEENLVQTEKRALSMFSYLLQKGVPKSRLVARGYGETELRSERDTPFINYRNERIELRLGYK